MNSYIKDGIENLCICASPYEEDGAIFTSEELGNNTYQIITKSWAASAYANDGSVEYYFVTELQGIFNSYPAYTKSGSTQRGYYARNYTITALIDENVPSAPKNAILVEASPETTQGASSITTGVNYSLSGAVGFDGSGSLSSGAEFSRSHSYNIPDVAIANLTDPAQASFKVNFHFADPPWEGPKGPASRVGPVPLAAKSTFEPWCYWVWKIPKQEGFNESNLSLKIRVILDAEIKKRLVTSKRRQKHKYDTVELADVYIPIPPDPPIERKLK